MADDPLIGLMLGAFVAAGLAVGGIWFAVLVAAVGRAAAARLERPAGTAPVVAGALAGVALGGVTAGFTALIFADFLGARVNPPDLSGLLLLAIPVGLVACPGLVLWGLVSAWRVAERLPDDAPPGAARRADPRGADEEVNPLDAPFAPPPPKPAAPRDGGST